MRQPTWVGIGAQRSGTTWFTNLLCQHPQVNVPGREDVLSDDRDHFTKELHFFDRYLTQPFGEEDVDRYRGLFHHEGDGEWTPAYLRSMWVPALLRRAAPEALVLVLLRDPVDRMRSAMRWYGRSIPRSDHELPRWSREKGSDAIWAGMYGLQLREWSRHFPRDGILVMQYEAVRLDPQTAVDGVWRRLGLDPVLLNAVEDASTTTTSRKVVDAVETKALQAIYADDVRAVVDTWGLDIGLWTNFS